MNIKRFLFAGGIIFLQCVSVTANALDPIDQVEGVYVQKGFATRQNKKGGDFVPVPGATDCLVIRRIDDMHAEVYMSSIQARGFGCYLEGRAKEKDGQLVLDGENGPDQDDGVVINFGENKIGFSYVSERSKRRCGENASLKRIEFVAESRKIPWSSKNDAPHRSIEEFCPKWNR